MDREDNDNGPNEGEELHSRLINWIFLPVPLAIAVLGLGILLGIVFKENLLLQGPMKWIFGLALTLYGLIRAWMIFRKLKGKRENVWREKS